MIFLGQFGDLTFLLPSHYYLSCFSLVSDHHKFLFFFFSFFILHFYNILYFSFSFLNINKLCLVLILFNFEFPLLTLHRSFNNITLVAYLLKLFCLLFLRLSYQDLFRILEVDSIVHPCLFNRVHFIAFYLFFSLYYISSLLSKL